MRKQAIIVGVFILLVALVVFRVYIKIENTAKVAEKAEVVYVESEPTVVEKVVEKEVEVEKIVEKIVEVPAQIERDFYTLEASALSGDYQEYEKIMMISEKNILLVDTQVGSTEGKQVYPVVDVVGTGGDTLRLFFTQSVYDALNVGDNLKIVYKSYTNSAGVKFPVVVSAQKVN